MGKNNSKAIVPIESWAYASPELRINNKIIDMGLLCEALLYYDNIIVDTGNQFAFAELINWFDEQDLTSTFLSLVNEGVITFIDFGFICTSVEKDGVYSIWNLQDELQMKPDTFEARYLYHPKFEETIKNRKIRRKFYSAFKGNVIEEKAISYESTVEEARKDLRRSERTALLVQAYVDDLYKLKSKKAAPTVTAVSREVSPDLFITNFNIDFEFLKFLSGDQLNWHNNTYITANAKSIQYLTSASRNLCDLYLPSPMSKLAGDKLYETAFSKTKSKEIIETLSKRVEFPNVRKLVNEGKLNFLQILEIRKKSHKFREWLQFEGTRDYDALIAYHNETAKDMGLSYTFPMDLKLFGAVSGAVIGGAVGGIMAGPFGGAAGAIVGTALSSGGELAESLTNNWKPVVFGRWLSEKISSITN